MEVGIIGGDLEAFGKIEQLFQDVSTDNHYLYAGPSRSGHFLKMVHNGIEYDMMEAITEGFEVLEKSPFDFLKICSHSSPIASKCGKILRISPSVCVVVSPPFNVQFKNRDFMESLLE